MAASAHLYEKLYAQQFGAAPINWASDTIKVALCSNAYTPNQTTHDFFNDITNEVIGSTGYTAGGIALTSKTLTDSGLTATFDAADTTWASSTITARYAIIYKSTGTASTSPLIMWMDFGLDIQSGGANFIINWDSAGIFTLSVA